MATDHLTEERVRIESAGEHASASVQTADGRWIRYHSGRQPVAEADRFIESALGSIPGGSPAVVMMIGPGLGYAIDAIARRAPETRIIAIEPFAALAEGMRARRDWRDLIESRKLTLLVGPDYRGAAEVGPTLDENTTASAIVIEHPVLTREFPDDTVRARAVADGILEGAKLNAEARKMFAGRYLLNTLRNLPAIVDEADVESLRDAFTGTPAIVVAAGPSLDSNIEQLKALQDRALIIAVDTSLRPLRAAGIRPHLVVAVDPSDLNAKHLLGLHDTDSSWLVAEGSLDSRVFPPFAGRVFTFKVSGHQPWPWLNTHALDRGRLRAWGSVLTTAFDLAIHAGCDPIAFAGADLAFTGGVHYCRGTMNELASLHDAPADVRAEGFAMALREQQRPTSMAADIHGNQVVSTPLFTQFRDWITVRATEAAPRRILNATGAGILHGDGITQADLRTLVLPSIDGGREAIRARLANAWRSDQAESTRVREALAETLQQGRAAVPMAAWVDFACGGATADEISALIDAGWRTAPSITKQPRSQRRLAGWDATFTAAASGGPVPSVRWQESVDDGATWSDIAGATSRTCVVRAPDVAGDKSRAFRAVFTNSFGTAATEPATLGAATPGSPRDFNGDGVAEVLWHHYGGTGMVAVWHPKVGYPAYAAFDHTEADTAWRVVGIGDFNGDGKPDLLWRHNVLGANRIWHLDGLTVVDVEAIVSEDDVEWQVAGIGDFNGDGKPDVLWRHSTSGQIAVWCMDGTTRAAVVPLETEADLNWTIVGVADVNGDGTPDILWRNLSTGAIAVWYMDGMTRIGRADLPAEPDSAWRIMDVANFTGEGDVELLWSHATSGENRIWTFDRGRRIATRDLHLVDELKWVICPEKDRS